MSNVSHNNLNYNQTILSENNITFIYVYHLGLSKNNAIFFISQLQVLSIIATNNIKKNILNKIVY